MDLVQDLEAIPLIKEILSKFDDQRYAGAVPRSH
jgi:hypothetical protein